MSEKTTGSRKGKSHVSARSRGAATEPKIPGKGSAVARWRRVLTLADQAIEAFSAGDRERLESTLEALRAIAAQAVRDFDSLR